jgi:hypothetical protein
LSRYLSASRLTTHEIHKTQTKTAFGQVRHYVVDPVQADALKTLTGKITVSDRDLIALQLLGFSINGVNYTQQLKLAV